MSELALLKVALKAIFGTTMGIEVYIKALIRFTQLSNSLFPSYLARCLPRSFMSFLLSSISLLALLAVVYSAPAQLSYDQPTPSPAAAPDFLKQNGLDAQKLNSQFATMKPTDSCQSSSYFQVTALCSNRINRRSDGLCHLSFCPMYWWNMVVICMQLRSRLLCPSPRKQGWYQPCL